ncbi:MAG: bifunctional 3-deoxy-7-phosphoheptulonate synthase/chorismate mutase type II [Bacteroidales bacterium]|jgi:chorismate mutase|nr:bifunctional 3-deoxy-7-phosphoheptulonate synthase/chorismate mutase type II [Bacteroidales bacterium]
MKPLIIAGPCAAETENQVLMTAHQLQIELKHIAMPLAYFRVGVWKPRSNPCDFGGAGKRALKWLAKARNMLQTSVCVEVARPEQIELCREAGINAIWLGARTTVNPFLVQEMADALRGSNFTVMIKNPVSPDLSLWIGAIERMREAGITDLIAIHRGFAERRENILRNAPIWEIPIELKIRFPNLPLICDPSHLTGDRRYIRTIAQEALNYGFSGLMIETHYNPTIARSDARQQITPKELAFLLDQLDFKTESETREFANISKEREQLHAIDDQIAQLLTKRMRIVDKIACLKHEYHLPIVQPNQWQKVVEQYLSHSLQDDYYQEFITKFLELLHQNSIKRQNR